MWPLRTRSARAWWSRPHHADVVELFVEVPVQRGWCQYARMHGWVVVARSLASQVVWGLLAPHPPTPVFAQFALRAMMCQLPMSKEKWPAVAGCDPPPAQREPLVKK